MPKIMRASDERYWEIKNLVKLYLALIVVGWSFFLLLKVPTPANIPLDSNMIMMVKFGIQSILANAMTLQIYLLVLLIYTFYVAMETLEYLRACAGRMYYKYKQN